MTVSLADLLAAKRAEIARLDPPALPARSRPRRDFAAALRRPDGGTAVIAEIKRASPSHGPFGAEPEALLAAYEAAGVDALSILTDRHFSMSGNDLATLGSRTRLPILRKDFILEERQLEEAERLGADAVLLIASILTEEELRRLGEAAARRRLDVLYEVHAPAEIARLPRGARIIGVNNRNLADPRYATDLAQAKKMLQELPPEAIKVAESGYESAAGIPSGCDAVLVGAGLIREFLRRGDVKEIVKAMQQRQSEP